MHALIGLLLHDLGMALRRRSLWIAYGALFAFHTVVLFSPPPLGEWVAGEVVAPGEAWSVAGRFAAALNVFFPVVAGILAADRVERDFRLGMRELQESTGVAPGVYVLAKYAGTLAASLVPLFLWVTAVALVMTAIGHTPAAFLGAAPVALLAITVPALAFVVAFSIACPLFLPLPVYHVLFTGYWFWANFVPPDLFPTLNGTLLTPSGMFALAGFFGGPVPEAVSRGERLGPGDAVLNLTVLLLCAASVLVLLERHLSRRARLA